MRRKGKCVSFPGNRRGYTTKEITRWDVQVQKNKADEGSGRQFAWLKDEYLPSLCFRLFLHHHSLSKEMTVLAVTSCVRKGGLEGMRHNRPPHPRFLPCSCPIRMTATASRTWCCYFWWCLRPGTMGRWELTSHFSTWHASLSFPTLVICIMGLLIVLNMYLKELSCPFLESSSGNLIFFLIQHKNFSTCMKD